MESGMPLPSRKTDLHIATLCCLLRWAGGRGKAEKEKREIWIFMNDIFNRQREEKKGKVGPPKSALTKASGKSQWKAQGILFPFTQGYGVSV